MKLETLLTDHPGMVFSKKCVLETDVYGFVCTTPLSGYFNWDPLIRNKWLDDYKDKLNRDIDTIRFDAHGEVNRIGLR